MISTPRIPIMRYFNTGADPYLQRSVLAHPQQYVPYFFRELPRFASKPKNELGFTDFWSLNHHDWIAANFPHCKKCCNPHHPGYPATPAFLDCKHGHYLSRDRIEQQMEWKRIRNFWGRICMAAAFVYIVRGTAGAILIFYPLVIVTLVPWLIQYEVHKRGQINKLRLLAAHPEVPAEMPFLWEKKDRGLLLGRILRAKAVNEPWHGRIF